MNQLFRDYKPIQLPDGLSVVQSPRQFQKRGTISKHRHVVWHENAGMYRKNLEGTCLAKGYGYHLVIDWDGTVYQYNDLQDVLWAGNQCNKTGVHVCVVNPYYPSVYKPKNLKGHEKAGMRRVIKSRWWTHIQDGDKRYVTPTQLQLQAAIALAPILSEALDVPLAFPTIDLGAPGKPRKIRGYQKLPKGWSAKPGDGHVAHRDYSNHSDGRYVLETIFKSIEDIMDLDLQHVASIRPMIGEDKYEENRTDGLPCPHCGKKILLEKSPV